MQKGNPGQLLDQEASIVVLRGQRVILDQDLAALYGINTGRLNEQVRRNRERFPAEFVFEVSVEELSNLMSQIAISSWGGRRKPALAFTEHGVVMAATILKSKVAVQASIELVKAFVRLRQAAMAYKDLAKKVDELEQKYDGQFRAVFNAIRQLIEPQHPKKERLIGFGR